MHLISRTQDSTLVNMRFKTRDFRLLTASTERPEVNLVSTRHNIE